jgi:protein-L-isoaspartate(D-aspartate) O-methyltransferase
MDARRRMVAEQIRARGVVDRRVLDAMEKVPRELFIPEAARGEAHEDRPVPIGFGVTISQPYIVGYMTEALKVEASHRVLEIGTGCGYQTAVLAELAARVYSIEVIPELAARARATLEGLGYTNVVIRTGDGHQGWPDEAPFDRILGAAAATEVPSDLVDQLADGGIMVLPIERPLGWQELQVLRKRDGRMSTESTLPVRFVPMIRSEKAH